MNIEDKLTLLDKSKSINNDIGLERIYESLSEYNEDLLGLFTNQLGGNVSEVRLTSYFLFSWNDTDTLVGYTGYYLDGIPVGYSKQMGRKSMTTYNWFSRDKAYKVKKYIETLLDDRLYYKERVEEDIELKLNDATQITSVYTPYYQGRKVRYDNEGLVMEYGNNIPQIEGDTFREYVILQGIEGKVKVSDLDFKLNLKSVIKKNRTK